MSLRSCCANSLWGSTSSGELVQGLAQNYLCIGATLSSNASSLANLNLSSAREPTMKNVFGKSVGWNVLVFKVFFLKLKVNPEKYGIETKARPLNPELYDRCQNIENNPI